MHFSDIVNQVWVSIQTYVLCMSSIYLDHSLAINRDPDQNISQIYQFIDLDICYTWS